MLVVLGFPVDLLSGVGILGVVLVTGAVDGCTVSKGLLLSSPLSLYLKYKNNPKANQINNTITNTITLVELSILVIESNIDVLD